MQRRNFLKKAQVGGLGLCMAPDLALGSSFNETGIKGLLRVPLQVVGTTAALEKDKRIAFGWAPHILNPDGTVLLKPDRLPREGHIFLRLSVAVEMWEQAILQVSIPDGHDGPAIRGNNIDKNQ